ncbi:hypothetical protein L6R53_13740 [Myxococcota bacterium]|nr:hypothetical protein [Myxococcota bacterium]
MLLALSLLLACASQADPVDTGPFDRDEDGVVAAEDCDDADPSVYPGADEHCDGRDEDCDEEVDEEAVDPSTFFVDADGDGYGDTAATVQSCAQPEGAADIAGDCDDLRGDVHPGADELCLTGVDEDCDGVVDEDDAADATAWHLDADGDGYGDPLTLLWACEQPEGMTADAQDCDDSDPALNPDTPWYDDVDSDGFAGDVPATTACEQPEGLSATPQDCDDADPTVYPGAPEICEDGKVNGCEEGVDAARACLPSGERDERDATLELVGSTAAYLAGAAMAGADLTGDGRDDLLVGAPYSYGSRDAQGAVFIVPGPAETGAEALTDYDAVDGATDRAQVGTCLDTADLDGDGYVDLLVGGLGEGSGEGAVWLMPGPLTSSTTTATASTTLRGTATTRELGMACRFVSDQDGDGVVDLLMSAAGGELSEHNAVLLVSGTTTGEEDAPAVALAVLAPAARGLYMGLDVEDVGDLDGDGAAELAITSYLGDRLWILAGPVRADRDLADGADVELWSEVGAFATAVEPMGDLDGDGTVDLAVGSASHEGDSRGSMTLFLGPFLEHRPVAEADLIVRGSESQTYLGGSLDTLADMDADGLPELLVGSGRSLLQFQSGTSSPGISEAWLFRSAGALSGPTGTLELAAADLRFDLSRVDDDGPTRVVAGAGDLGGDGTEDVAFASGFSQNSVWLFELTGY